MTNERTYPYDVFISYRWVNPDMRWVRDHLEPALEAAGLKVFLDVDDFVPGRNLIREMERAGIESRRAICVVSPAYFEDDGRMVNFEEPMFRQQDPSGQDSLLIPLVIRPTEMPLRLRGYLAVDWTDPEQRQREWTKLLRVLGARNQDVPPPLGLPEPDGPGPVPPEPPQEPPEPFPKPSPYLVIPIILVLALIVGLAAYFLSTGGARPKAIEGIVYYQSDGSGGALVPAENVVVSLSRRRSLKSEPTGADGKFVIPDVPDELQGTQLTATLGSLDFPPMDYRETGDYAVIPRRPEQRRDIRPITEPWSEAPTTDDCLSENPAQFTHFRQFWLETELPKDRKQAEVTVSLKNTGEAVLLDASVISPALHLNLYRDVSVPGQNLEAAHTWLFDIPENGLAVKLAVCVGSNESADAASSANLEASCELH